MSRKLIVNGNYICNNNNLKDLHTENVRQTKNGTIKILDF
jgi:hypothetical protein